MFFFKTGTIEIYDDDDDDDDNEAQHLHGQSSFSIQTFCTLNTDLSHMLLEITDMTLMQRML